MIEHPDIVAMEARHERLDELPLLDDDRPTPSDLAYEERGGRPERQPVGTCPGCGERVPAKPGSVLPGACWWRGEAWHPACREQDKAEGGTNRWHPKADPARIAEFDAIVADMNEAVRQANDTSVAGPYRERFEALRREINREAARA